MSNVAIVYHFFPHYRAAINTELLYSPNHHFIFVGDNRDPSSAGIKEWDFADASRFIHTKSRFFFGRYLVQSGLVCLALRQDIDTIIYLGDVQGLTTWLSASIARLNGKRVLFWSHGWTRRESGLKGWIRTRFYKLAHGLLLYGNRAKAIGVEKGFKPESLYVIYNSLNYELQKDLRDQNTKENTERIRHELFEDADLPMIICTTRLIPTTRLDLLLDALYSLKSQDYRVNLLLVGDGPERSRLQQLSEKHGLAVKFYGECYDEQILANLLMAADVTVAPGKVGLTAIHSLVYGVPVITHDNPDNQMPESEAITEGITGDLFKWSDSKDLARLIRKWTSDERRSSVQVRNSCYEVIDRYYNPEYQRIIIEQAIDGVPAQDKLWAKFTNAVSGMVH
ncbi:MAG: glycosyltransferase family 4 protein [Sedimentisphaerales bacterium]|nr:glycosyltransferase family 4 protein [Sedimentisphaerales bacterium]